MGWIGEERRKKPEKSAKVGNDLDEGVVGNMGASRR
jgi:hypothetical protein